LNDVEQLPIEICRQCSDKLLKQAAFLKINEKVSLADSFALGLAKLKNAKLVSTDHHEFDIIDQKGLSEFYWLR